MLYLFYDQHDIHTNHAHRSVSCLSLLQTAPTNFGSLWDSIDAARAGDPRAKVNPYAKQTKDNAKQTEGGPQQPPARLCPPKPPEVVLRAEDGHEYPSMTETTLKKGAGVSKVFATTLADVPLFQGTSAGIAPIHNHRYPWPHENLLRPGEIDEDGNAVVSDKADNTDYYMLPDNATANRITGFHQFCLQMPDVMCNYCSITLYPEDVHWVNIDGPEGKQPPACRASTQYSHVAGIDDYAARSTRITDSKGRQYAFCKRYKTDNGRKEWVFDDIGGVPPVIECLSPPERRASALLRMRCCLFKGGGGVGSGYEILKGAAEYVPADFDGSVGSIAIDPDKTAGIRPDKVDAAVEWLNGHNPLVRKYLTLWDTHQTQLSQTDTNQPDAGLPSGFPTLSCPRGRGGDSTSDVQGLVLPSGVQQMAETHNSDLRLNQLVAGEVLPRTSSGNPTPTPTPTQQGQRRAFSIYYDPYTGNAKDSEHCMELLRSVHLFPFGKGGYTRGVHGEFQYPAMDHAAYVKIRMLQVDPRFRNPAETYLFAAVDDKTKQSLHRANTRSTTYSNLEDAGEGFMQRLDEDTRAERDAENNDAVTRVCKAKGIPLHSGKHCPMCASVAGGICCMRCKHFLDKDLAVCPHCDGQPTRATRPGEDGKLPMLHGLERITQAFPTNIVGGRSYWALKLKELLAMVDSPAVGRPDVFITKTCHEGSDDMKRLLLFLGCPSNKTATEWPKYQVEITRHWRRNVMEWLSRYVQ